MSSSFSPSRTAFADNLRTAMGTLSYHVVTRNGKFMIGPFDRYDEAAAAANEHQRRDLLIHVYTADGRQILKDI